MSDSKSVRNGGGEMRQYLEYVDDQHFTMLGLEERYRTRNPFPLMQQESTFLREACRRIR